MKKAVIFIVLTLHYSLSAMFFVAGWPEGPEEEFHEVLYQKPIQTTKVVKLYTELCKEHPSENGVLFSMAQDMHSHLKIDYLSLLAHSRPFTKNFDQREQERIEDIFTSLYKATLPQPDPLKELIQSLCSALTWLKTKVT